MRGLKRHGKFLLRYCLLLASKNQNPREGIETVDELARCRGTGATSKNQNPREGIETVDVLSVTAVSPGVQPSKNQNPREGIETEKRNFERGGVMFELQKTKIPVRGLKPNDCQCARGVIIAPSKNQNPREGIETAFDRLDLTRFRLSSKNQNPREGIETDGPGSRQPHCC